MVIEISDFLSRVEASQYSIFTQKFHASVSKTLRKFNGTIKSKDNNNYLVVFSSVTDTVQCALEIQYKFKYVTPKHEAFSRRLNIGMTISKELNEEDLILATRMCEIVKEQLVISTKVKESYENSNEHAAIDGQLIRTLTLNEVTFLTQIMNQLELNWMRSDFNWTSISKSLGYTYSQIYRRLKNLSGKSPNKFIKEFRLHKALVFLHDHSDSISVIANKTGFNSPNYFAQCFREKYGVRPSKYRLQHT
ncbi:MAG: helix-turn-helix transcriptional regulator [Flavobacteriaceae bacterium]|nr:helix-turn-helix transcriptional regulator [Bacteroidia bacterium]NND09874.1 helix-turn-helix transcriptional regulator [Flavobacteriaceae bacterium]NNK29047.1 helix-turn-helix transcriptional regulator [Flavobacteriaceae bacterium]NNL59878.1 helix-turn-helix transcriptional regulator [Flavobacteriaceae bacterium]